MKKIYKNVFEANVEEIMDYAGLSRKDTIQSMVREFNSEKVIEIMIEDELTLEEALGKLTYEKDMKSY